MSEHAWAACQGTNFTEAATVELYAFVRLHEGVFSLHGKNSDQEPRQSPVVDMKPSGLHSLGMISASNQALQCAWEGLVEGG